uniref:Uncharacterized protein n=1 Tax=Daphnia galeata TaxID=27404 RepID=A0A8J2RQU1_9CRUS|nr:unnamed protein product [Daphnia galeata]
MKSAEWDLSRRHHYANSNRIPNILVDMTVSWRAYSKSEWILPGNHGWDNLTSDMNAMFVAQGPSFKKKIEDSTLNITESSSNEALKLHTPWGAAQTGSNQNIKAVINNDYVAAFDVVSNLANWTSYTLKQPRLANFQPQRRLDVRLEPSYASICDISDFPAESIALGP